MKRRWKFRRKLEIRLHRCDRNGRFLAGPEFADLEADPQFVEPPLEDLMQKLGELSDELKICRIIAKRIGVASALIS